MNTEEKVFKQVALTRVENGFIVDVKDHGTYVERHWAETVEIMRSFLDPAGIL